MEKVSREGIDESVPQTLYEVPQLFVGHRMSMKRSVPVYISEPDPESKFIEDRLHWAIL